MTKIKNPGGTVAVRDATRRLSLAGRSGPWKQQNTLETRIQLDCECVKAIVEGWEVKVPAESMEVLSV